MFLDVDWPESSSVMPRQLVHRADHPQQQSRLEQSHQDDGQVRQLSQAVLLLREDDEGAHVLMSLDEGRRWNELVRRKVRRGQ